MTKRHKYGAKRTTVDGVAFDSRAEAARHAELVLLERAGRISGLQRQPRFTVFKVGQVTIEYVADFFYREGSEHVVEDVKGHITDPYRMKRKMFLATHFGVAFYEITRGRRRRMAISGKTVRGRA